MDAVAFAFGSSSASATSAFGYAVEWARISFPLSPGYEVIWASIRLPYQIKSVVIEFPGGHGKVRRRGPARRVVNDDIDLQDLAEIWGLLCDTRKAA